MDFFSHQDRARKKTAVLIVYFGIAVLLIILITYGAVAAFFRLGDYKPNRAFRVEALWDPQLFVWIAGGTLFVIIMGSLYKISVLSGGGEIIARMLGGRPVNPNTPDKDEQLLLNVVEEMAIASGVPVPPVFVLKDRNSINAFAAGFTPNDAVIGVTRGTINLLTRDEMQGIIAHEFSHILNGDIYLNIRLMGVLHGILSIALLGYRIIPKRGGIYTVLGLVLVVIGYVGVFFGKLIKAAVSRQRECLADASAIQFTRNPLGIAGALKKIGGSVSGSRIESLYAQEASHLFFADALRQGLTALLSTHPPLEERIRRIDPSFDGVYPKVTPLRGATPTVTTLREIHAAAMHKNALFPMRNKDRTVKIPFSPDAAIARIGTLNTEQIVYASALLNALPETWMETVHEPLGAVAAIFCLLLSEDEAVRKLQRERLAEQADPHVHPEIERLLPRVSELAPAARLALVEMTLPSLRHLSFNQYHHFHKTIQMLIEADKGMSLFEYALQRMLLDQLCVAIEKRPRIVHYHALTSLWPRCAGLLSTLAYAGHTDQGAAALAFASGATRLGKATASILPPEETGFHVMDYALNDLVAASPAIKKRILRACVACVGADGKVTLEEAELLRVLASSLDCPMPSLSKEEKDRKSNLET